MAFLSAKVCTGVVRASTTCWPCVTTNGTCWTEVFSTGLFERNADAAANGAVDHEDRREDQEGDH